MTSCFSRFWNLSISSTTEANSWVLLARSGSTLLFACKNHLFTSKTTISSFHCTSTNLISPKWSLPQIFMLWENYFCIDGMNRCCRGRLLRSRTGLKEPDRWDQTGPAVIRLISSNSCFRAGSQSEIMNPVTAIVSSQKVTRRWVMRDGQKQTISLLLPTSCYWDTKGKCVIVFVPRGIDGLIGHDRSLVID